MRILFIHNKYGKTSGEEISIKKIVSLLKEKEHEVVEYYRSSEGIGSSKIKIINALVSNFFNFRSYFEIIRIVKRFNPDVIQIQNLYPLISPSILLYLKKTNTPILMRAPNYRLFCPNGLFMRPTGEICEKCTLNGKELWGIYHNCESDMLKSFIYSLRNLYARKFNLYLGSVDVFFVQSRFQKRKFIENGVDSKSIVELPGFLNSKPFLNNKKQIQKEFFGYIGRFSYEKGVYDFLELARQNANLCFAIAGDIPEDKVKMIPSNVVCFGFIDKEEMDVFLNRSICLIIPSKCYEGFPNVILQAMVNKVPIIASKIGVLSEIIVHKDTGLSYTPGNIAELSLMCKYILNNPRDVEKMAAHAYKQFFEKYTDKAIYNILYSTYKKLVQDRLNLN